MFQKARTLFLFILISTVFCSRSFGTVADPDWTVTIKGNVFGLQQYALYGPNGEAEQHSTVICYGPGRFTLALPIYAIITIAVGGLALVFNIQHLLCRRRNKKSGDTDGGNPKTRE